MIKEVMVALVVGLSPPIPMDVNACIAARDNIRLKGLKAECVTEVNDNKVIEAQIRQQLKEVQEFRRLLVIMTKINRQTSWCQTIARNGSFPGKVHAFSKKEKYWPEGIKLTLDQCIRLIGERGDPTSGEPPEATVANLIRGYK
jgi:hypothetical protein